MPSKITSEMPFRLKSFLIALGVALVIGYVAGINQYGMNPLPSCPPPLSVVQPAPKP